MFAQSKVVKKLGTESFSFQDKKLSLTVLDFWQWSSSDLLGNALRGKLAEFIVASAIDCLDSLRVEWDDFDLITKNSIKIEVKSSAYLQSWEQSKFSKISFGIQPTGVSQSNSQSKVRKSDIYIFCLLAHKDKNTVNPLCLEQWEFYVLPTKVFNERMPEQKTITLSSLLLLNPLFAKYDNLNEVISQL